jgi:Uma2 family endonuclease
MSTTTQQLPSKLQPIYRFTVKTYHRMIESGILTPDDKVELIHGWIVEKMPQNPPHSSTITRLIRNLSGLVLDGWCLRVQCPITLRDSEPEPDVVIARGPEERYDATHPTPRDIALVIEVADSSLLDDRSTKASLYAGEKIVELWIVNLVTQNVEVHTNPRTGKDPTYKSRKEYTLADSVPLRLGGAVIAEIRVEDLIPPKA